MSSTHIALQTIKNDFFRKTLLHFFKGKKN